MYNWYVYIMQFTLWILYLLYIIYDSYLSHETWQLPQDFWAGVYIARKFRGTRFLEAACKPCQYKPSSFICCSKACGESSITPAAVQYRVQYFRWYGPVHTRTGLSFVRVPRNPERSAPTYRPSLSTICIVFTRRLPLIRGFSANRLLSRSP